MPTLVMDPRIEEELLERRRACGGDRFDEVWEGVYVMSPMANVEHQAVVTDLAIAIGSALADQPQVRVYAGVNVSDRRKDWEKNYRCPDLAVVLSDSAAADAGAFLLGGPDFVIEVSSDYDRSREKFDFYAHVGVREMLLVDRNPWQLELYRLENAALKLAGTSEPSAAQTISSQVLPLTFRLLARTSGRPQIEVAKPATSQRWFA